MPILIFAIGGIAGAFGIWSLTTISHTTKIAIALAVVIWLYLKLKKASR